MTTPSNTSSNTSANNHGANGTGRTATGSSTGSRDLPATRDDRRAGKAGLGVAALGVVVLNVAPFMNWVDPAGDGDPRTGYASDSLVPFTAYLALGLLLAMLYAATRARRGQHRGLTLVSMAAGLAATVQFVAFAVQPMGGLERSDDLVAQVGVYVAIVGSALWALGSGLLAKEIEGDDHHGELTSAR